MQFVEFNLLHIVFNSTFEHNFPGLNVPPISIHSSPLTNLQSRFPPSSEVNVQAPEFKLKPAAEAKQSEKLAWEKELLGLYISGHPLDRVRDKLKDKPINIKKIKEDMGNGLPITIGGMILNVKTVITKKNEQMAFLTIEDLTGTIEAVVFPKLYKESSSLLVPEKCIALSGKISLRKDEKSLVIEAVKEI